MISKDDAIKELIELKVASNIYEAGYIVDGLFLTMISEKKNRAERALLYRAWRNAGENVKMAYLRTIKGEIPPTLLQP
jgi:hypothetical protein